MRLIEAASALAGGTEPGLCERQRQTVVARIVVMVDVREIIAAAESGDLGRYPSNTLRAWRRIVGASSFINAAEAHRNDSAAAAIPDELYARTSRRQFWWNIVVGVVAAAGAWLAAVLSMRGQP